MTARTSASLSAARWQELEPLLDAALALSAERRAAFLDVACGTDLVMRQELADMLVACERLAQADPLLERPAAERFASLWEDAGHDETARLAVALADRYALEGETGRGGMAIVYRARDLRHGRPVALKVLRTALSDASAARFRREIALSANLQHPHILSVFDSGESAGRLWYTMPFVDGESLGARLRRERRVAIPEAVRLLREIADALDYAHAHGLVHRDLKPDNVLLSGDHAVIADFGVAKAISAARGSSSRAEGDSAPALSVVEGRDLSDSGTSPGVTIGTPAYMAPEQAAGDPAVDARADLYALGVIAYELFAGVTPFTGTSRQALLAAHLAERPVPVSVHRSDVPRGLERLVMRLLAKSPGDRPQNATEVIAGLDAPDVVAHETVDAVREGTARATRSPRPWQRWAVAFGVVVVGVVVAWRMRPESPLPPVRSVLVLPLENETGDTSLARFGSAASDWIAQGLARTNFVDVVSPTSATASDPRAAAIASRAGLAISGRYFVLGDSIRVQLRVDDVARATLLPGTTPVSAPRTTPAALLEPLGNQVLSILTPRLDPRIAEWSMGALPGSTAALYAFLDGLDLMSQGDIRGAIVHWARAAALDTTYMQPRLHSVAALASVDPEAADALLMWVERRRTKLTPGDLAWLDFDRGALEGNSPATLTAARALVKAEPGAQLPYWFLALSAVRLNRPHEAIEASKHVNSQAGRFRYEWAGQIYFATLTDAYHQLGEHQIELDSARAAARLHPENREIVVYALRALAALGSLDGMDPLLVKLETLGQAPNGRTVPDLLLVVAGELQQHGHIVEGRQVLRRTEAWQRARPPAEQQTSAARFNLGRALFFLREYDEAARLFTTLVREAPQNASFLAYNGAIAGILGRRSIAEQMSTRLAASRRRLDRGQTTYARAQLAAWLGDTTTALTLLERSFTEGMPAEGISPHNDLMLSPLWTTARFKDLLRPRD